jgi:hypothetical protein
LAGTAGMASSSANIRRRDMARLLLGEGATVTSLRQGR